MKRIPLICILIPLLILTGCSTLPNRPSYIPPTHPEQEQTTQQCQQWITDIDNYVHLNLNQTDAQYQRITNRPWLRTDRFWWSLSKEVQKQKSSTQTNLITYQKEAIFNQWLVLGKEGFLNELHGVVAIDEAALLACIDRVAQLEKSLILDTFFPSSSNRDLHHTSTSSLKPMIQPIKPILTNFPDHYLTTNRILGLYPLIKPVVLNRIHNFQKTFKATINNTTQESQWITKTPFIQYHPNIKNQQTLTQSHLHSVIKNASQSSPLSLPTLATESLEQLYHHFAPTLFVEPGHPDDQIASIQLNPAGDIYANTQKPTLYTYHTYTHFYGEKLLQLNYAFWFPSRPSDDVYGGFLDGLIWRVTLDNRGNVLLFDTIHQCGCYHKFFLPSDSKLIAKAWNESTEPPIIFNLSSQQSDPTNRTALYINTIEHYILRVDRLPSSTVRSDTRQIRDDQTLPTNNQSYELKDYAELARLENVDQGQVIRKKLFNNTGLIDGSERTERFFFWPLGIESAGAMRQKGTHAVAFIGRRHFDDPYLLERLFVVE